MEDLRKQEESHQQRIIVGKENLVAAEVELEARQLALINACTRPSKFMFPDRTAAAITTASINEKDYREEKYEVD